MANELALALAFNYLKNGVADQDGGTDLITVAGSGAISNDGFATSTVDTAIPLAGVTPGFGYFKNLDATNDIIIKSAVSGTAFITLKPGQRAWVPFHSGVTAPSCVASASTPLLQYKIFPR